MPTSKPRITVYLDAELKNALDKLAAKENRSVSNLLLTLAKQEIERLRVNGELNEVSK